MRAYRALLRLYPRSFRAEYGEEMAAILPHRLRDAAGATARAALWIGVVRETLASALTVHLDILRQDLRYTVRALSRAKGFAVTAIAIVALGIGANTATFAVTDFVLLRTLPFPSADRLVSLWQSVQDYSRLELSPANYRDWTRAATSFQQTGAYTDTSLTLVGQGDPIRLEGTAVTASLFPTLEVSPRLGRVFAAGEDAPGATPTVVLSDRVWRTVFGEDETVIGRAIVLNDRPHSVIGVMGPAFSFPTSQAGLWVPLVFDDEAYSDRTNTYLRAVARLRPQASVASARAEMALIAERFARQFKDNDHLVLTGLLMRALWTIQATDPGFRAADVVTMRTTLPWPKYAPTAKRADFCARVLEQVRTVPGVSSAGYISFLPMVMRGGIWKVEVEGQPAEPRDQPAVSLRFVTPGFFESLGIPLHAGRDVRDGDTLTSQPVAVVSDSFAERIWPGQDPLGRRITVAFKQRTVVGVAGSVRVRGLERSSEPQVYLPNRQIDDGWMPFYAPQDLVIRTAAPLDQIVPAVRAIIHTVDPLQPIASARPMTAIVDAETVPRSVQARVLASFAIVAFLLAAIGIHGVLSFAVSQRTAEIGVRIALGAPRHHIVAMVLRQGLGLVAAALVPGLAIAYGAALALQSLLVGVTPGDLPTYAAATATIVVMACAGTLLPTLRAVRVDPVSAIRGV